MRTAWDASAALIPARVEFGSRGFEDASIVSIIERSGTTRATFYKHYESKRRLFFAAVLSALADMDQVLPEPDPSLPFWSDVEALVSAGHRFGLSNPSDVRLVHEGVRLAAEHPDEPLARVVISAVRERTGQWIDRGTRAGEVRADLGRDLAVDLVIAVVQTVDRRILEQRDQTGPAVQGARSTDLLRRLLVP